MISRIIVSSLLLLTVHLSWAQIPLRDKMDKIDQANKRRPVLFDDVRRDQLIELQDTILMSESQRTQIFQINNHYDIKLEAVRKSIVEKKKELGGLEKNGAGWRLINKKIDQLSKLLGQEIKINTKRRMEIRKVSYHD